MGMIPIGWDCYNAMNGQSPMPEGGRAFNMASMPILYQDSYGAYHGATREAQAQAFLVDILRWMRGGRSTGVVAVSPEPVDFDWYADGSNDLIIGLSARAAIQAAGFTIREYGPDKTADNLFAGTDIVIFDRWLQDNTGTDLDGIPVSETAPIWDYVVNQNKSILYLYAGNSAGGFGWGNGAAYAYPVGYFALYGYAGAEAIFENTFGGGQTLGVHTWGGRQAQGTGPVGSPAYGESYPSTKVASWRNATQATHYHVLAAFSNHGDIGNVGDSWA